MTYQSGDLEKEDGSSSPSSTTNTSKPSKSMAGLVFSAIVGALVCAVLLSQTFKVATVSESTTSLRESTPKFSSLSDEEKSSLFEDFKAKFGRQVSDLLYSFEIWPL